MRRLLESLENDNQWVCTALVSLLILLSYVGVCAVGADADGLNLSAGRGR